MFKQNYLTAILVLTSLFFGFHESTVAQIQKGLDIDGISIDDLSGYSVSMPDSNTIAIGSPQNDINGSNSGQARVYQWNGVSWIQKGMDLNGEAADDRSGQSVSMPDANTIAIASPYNVGNGTNAGHVRIYSWNGSNWVQKGVDIDGEASNNYSGSSISMPDSNTVAIGSPSVGFSGYWNGRVRIYIWNGSAWVQKGIDINGLLNSNEESGWSVSMPDANTVAIGAPSNEEILSWNGRVGIFSWNGSAWVQKGNNIYGQTFGSKAGASVSMSDSNTMVIGAPGYDTLGINTGYVGVYSWNGSDWIQKGSAIYGETAGDEFGYSVSMPDSNTVAIGARANNGNGTLAGHVGVFVWNGSTWIQNENDIDGEAANDQSGWSVSMPDAKTVGVGANLNDGGGIDAGHTRVYSFCATFFNYSASACSNYISPSGNYNWTSSGTFMDTIPNFEGCDSVITVNLTIGSTSGINPIACSSFTSPSGNYTWTSSGTFMDTIPNTAGCDSVITVNLTIANNSSSIDVIACFNYISPSGNYTWTSSGIFMDTIPNFDGCDSVITINLTINNVDVSINNLSPTLISNAIGASYQWLDCNEAMAIIGSEINQNFTAISNGIYAVQVTQNGCVDTSDCEVVNNVGIITISDEYSIEVYPNPSRGSFTVFIKNVSEGSLEIFDLAGRLQQIQRLNNSETYPVDGLHAGVYLVEVVMNNGRKEVKRVVVE